MSRWSRRTQFSSGGGVASGETPPPPPLGAVGLPTDGTWADGLVPVQEGEIVEDVLDSMNEVLVYLAPPGPPLISSSPISSNLTLYSGKIPQGLSSSWSTAGAPGSTQSSVVISSSVTLTVGPFGPGDKGTVTLSLNNSTLAILDISANFQESLKGSNQNLSQWNYPGVGSPISAGVIIFAGGTLTVTSCGIHNNFPVWQAITLQVSLTELLLDGKDTIKLLHAHDGGSQSKSWTVFYDSDVTALTFTAQPTVVEASPQYRWLSGIRYYDIGSRFNVAFTGNNCFKKTYHVSQVAYYSMPGLNVVTRNPSTVPSLGDIFTVNDPAILNASNVTSINARLMAGLRDPYGANVTSQSISENRLIHTYGTHSTEKAEYFLDEYYRLPVGAYNTVPNPLSGVWDSTLSLTNGNPQCWDTGLRFPTINFSAGYLPSQLSGRNYSAFSGPQTYIRSFKDNGVPHNSVVLTMPGTSVSPSGSGLNVFVKLPGQTGWLDAGTMFSPGDFTGIDNDGCLVSKSGSQYTLTFGTFDTSRTSWVILVKVILRSSSDFLTSIVTNW
jgi:hypothetical protein